MRARHSLPRLLAAAMLMVAAAAGWSWATTPQTIVIDGVNDFLPGNLVDADGGDTQFPNIDLGDAYATNDAVSLFLGLAQNPAGWSGVQLGVAIDVNTAAGGETDPWGRKLEWSLAPFKPDFMFYVNLQNNWQAGYRWNGSSWAGIGSAGPGALGWHTATAFKELPILLSTLGVTAGATIRWETWVTQDGPTKGPLDAMMNDGSQLSTPGFTLWDTASPIPMTDMSVYVVQAAADPDPPYITGVQPTTYPIGNLLDVYFNEPIKPTSVLANGSQFVFNGGVVVTGAAVAGNKVSLTLAAPIAASASLYSVTVTGVTDNANNPIPIDNVANRACFGIKDVVFRGKFGPFLDGQGAGPHAFSIEGDQAPLTFDPLCDTGIMTDTGSNDIWQAQVRMLYAGNCAAGTGSEDFEWKFNYNCGVWEPLANNRVHTLDIANGAQDVLEFWWADEDPTLFTTRAVAVEFHVDLNLIGYLPTDVIAINGNVLPLNFDVPSLNTLVDDGSGVDIAAGDGIYATLITFPAGSRKQVAYKFLQNGVYECAGQGDRSLFLNDAVYGNGSNGGPVLELPTVKFDYCSTTWRDVAIVFRVDFNNTAWEHVRPGDVVTVAGTPNFDDTFNWNVPSLNRLWDNGVAPDAVAGDKIYTGRVVFPAGGAQNIEYKYLFNDDYECLGESNRGFSVNPDAYDAGANPQILAVDVFQRCPTATPVPPARTGDLALAQNAPNPFNPSTVISFTVAREGRGSLRVYNLRGELVRTLHEGTIAAGEQSARWDGRTEAGVAAGSGAYIYRLEVDGQSLSRRMLLLK
ncbi:T9SS type A sorting domain-containing protein [bacterium]|nr:T9SS type A sorting domain-containing protein [bacterium]